MVIFNRYLIYGKMLFHTLLLLLFHTLLFLLDRIIDRVDPCKFDKSAPYKCSVVGSENGSRTHSFNYYIFIVLNPPNADILLLRGAPSPSGRTMDRQTLCTPKPPYRHKCHSILARRYIGSGLIWLRQFSRPCLGRALCRLYAYQCHLSCTCTLIL